MYASAYAAAVEPMSPRFTSAITRSPAARAYPQIAWNAATPSGPWASKNADWGLTATARTATASTMPRQNSPRSPSTAGGNRSASGSSPTTSWLRLRATASTSLSENCVTATVAILRESLLPRADRNAPRTREGPPQRPLLFEPAREEPARPSAALDRRLQGAAGRELRHASSRDLDLLGRIARVDPRARRAVLRLELPEAGERDVAPRLERVGDRVEERVDGLARVACGQLAPPSHLRHELLFGHSPLLLSLALHGTEDPNTAISCARATRSRGRSVATAPRDARARRLPPLRGRRRTPRSRRRDRRPAAPRRSRAALLPR